ncbi:MAG TPA: shikimate kinase [Terrimesophilobacter sp.]|jgi:Shikimate kinase|uniref:shikimate kinase n=1 Tax=Terrimesophilobacter sp. TaxID=2906435 RepID=UPI002F94B08F
MTSTEPLLVVIGPPGAGKSRLGKQVARLLRAPFVDTDRRIVAKHGPIATIFSEHGEEWFRKVERLEVAKALGERAVVSLGGGAILSPQTQDDLVGKRVALVTVSPEAVHSRIAHSTRPLLKDGLEAWQRIMAERREIYERLAVRVWDSSDRSVASMAHEIADWVHTAESAPENEEQP